MLKKGRDYWCDKLKGFETFYQLHTITIKG